MYVYMSVHVRVCVCVLPTQLTLGGLSSGDVQGTFQGRLAGMLLHLPDGLPHPEIACKFVCVCVHASLCICVSVCICVPVYV
jgi:hypothetical protein